MSIYSAFVTKRFIHQVELEKPKMFKTKKTAVKTYKTSITKMIAR